MVERVDYVETITDMQYRDRVDIKVIFNNQVQRCLQSIGTEYFPENVEALARILPTESYEKVMKRRDEWVVEVEDFDSVYSGPIPLGTIQKPLMEKIPGKDRRYSIPFKIDEEGKNIIDWDNPHIISPRRIFKEQPDHMLFFRFIMEEAQNVNVTWRMDPKNVEYGLYPEPQEFDPVTPVSEEDLKKNLDLALDTLQHKSWIFFEEKTPVKVMNFRGYAVGIGEGEKPWFFNEIAIRQTKQEPIVILITATQGKGKTYCAIRLGQIFDKRFNPEKQIAIERSEIVQLVSGQSTLKRDQVIIIDESQFGASARSWGSKEQQILMNFLAAARFHGFIIIIVALHRSMLDSIIRNRIVNYHVVMEDRGIATVYENKYQRFDEIHYPARRGILILRLPDYDRCSAPTCLTCSHRIECKSIRARYERKKKGFVTDEAEKQENKVMQKTIEGRADNHYIPILRETWKDLDLTQKNYIEPMSIRSAIYKKTGETISIDRSKRLRSMMMLDHKDIVEKLIERKRSLA